MSISAFGVEILDDISKASATGQRGDKRNTKYAGAAYGGAAAGGAVGRQVATRTAGTTPGDVGRLARSQMNHKVMAGEPMGPHSEKALRAMGENPGVKTGYKAGTAAMKDGLHLVRSVPGGARMVRGGKVGAAAGAAGGVAAYAAHRHNVKKSAFGVEILDDVEKAQQQKPASAGRYAAGMAFGGIHGAVAGKKGKKLAAFGSEVGHSVGGGILGSTAGAVLGRGKPGAIAAGNAVGSLAGSARAVHSNQAKGRYKRETSS